MKRLILGVALLAVLLALGIGVTAAMSRIHRPLAQAVTRAEAAAQAEDWDTARDELARAKKKWDHNRRFSASVADHEPMEELDAAFDEATVYARLEAQSECAAACARLEVQLLAMADAHALRWWTFM